jgi:hypothetical protein
VQPTSVRQHLALDAWLRAFASAVRERDYDAALEMFAEGSAGFGTVTGRWDGRAQLEREQWQAVVPACRHRHRCGVAEAFEALAHAAPTGPALRLFGPVERARGRARLVRSRLLDRHRR